MSGTASSGPRWPVGDRVDIHTGENRRTAAGSTFSVGALLVSVVFLVLLITDPAQLDAAYVWIGELPIVLEIIAWVILLPWMLAYLAWESSWELWLRIVVIAVLLGGVAQSFWRRGPA